MRQSCGLPDSGLKLLHCLASSGCLLALSAAKFPYEKAPACFPPAVSARLVYHTFAAVAERAIFGSSAHPDQLAGSRLWSSARTDVSAGECRPLANGQCDTGSPERPLYRETSVLVAGAVLSSAPGNCL